MELRVWNDRYYLHNCPRQGYADVSEYIKDEEGFYCCAYFCKFKFPSLIVTSPLPALKGTVNVYGHRTIACNIYKRETYNL